MARGRKRKTGKREPNGRIQRVSERDKGTKELQARRAAGIFDETIDTLHHKKIVTNEQADAFQRFSKARNLLYGPPAPKVNALAPMIPGEKAEVPDDRLKSAQRDFDAGMDALGRAGNPAQASVFHLMMHNEAVGDLAFLQAGLEALRGVFIGGKKKAA